MNKKETIELFELLEKLNSHFHQKSNYTSEEKSSALADEIYPDIKKFYYDIIWNELPEDYRKKIEEK